MRALRVVRARCIIVVMVPVVMRSVRVRWCGHGVLRRMRIPDRRQHGLHDDAQHEHRQQGDTDHVVEAAAYGHGDRVLDALPAAQPMPLALSIVRVAP